MSRQSVTRFDPKELDTFPSTTVFPIFYETPFLELVELCKSSRRLGKICRDWDTWAAKAQNNFGITPEEFRETSIKEPAERYRQIFEANPSDETRSSVERRINEARGLIQKVRIGNLNDIDDLITRGPWFSGEVTAAAAQVGRLDIIRYLFEHRGAWETSDTLLAAARSGHLDIVKYMMDHGGWNIESSLEEAAANGHVDIVDYLVSRGATFVETALQAAAANGHLNVVEYLLDHGAIFISSAIQAAEENGQSDVVKYLRFVQSKRW